MRLPGNLRHFFALMALLVTAAGLPRMLPASPAPQTLGGSCTCSDAEPVTSVVAVPTPRRRLPTTVSMVVTPLPAAAVLVQRGTVTRRGSAGGARAP